MYVSINVSEHLLFFSLLALVMAVRQLPQLRRQQHRLDHFLHDWLLPPTTYRKHFQMCRCSAPLVCLQALHYSDISRKNNTDIFIYATEMNVLYSNFVTYYRIRYIFFNFLHGFFECCRLTRLYQLVFVLKIVFNVVLFDPSTSETIVNENSSIDKYTFTIEYGGSQWK